MCTKWFADGDVHKYFSPYATPHDAFIAFMNVLDDLERRADGAAKGRPTARIPLVGGPDAAAAPAPAAPSRPHRRARPRKGVRPRVGRVPRAR